MKWRPFTALLLSTTAACFQMGKEEETVDPFRELEIVDDDVVGDPRADNATAGPWSFRHLAVEGAGGDEDVASRVVERAFAGSAAFEDVLTRWPRRADGHLDLSRAPMRLIAISNRIDLGRAPDAMSLAGEGRFAFAITGGAPATVILEYALPSVRSPAEWATEWHTLGRIDDREAYRRALEALTRSFADRGAALAQVRASRQGAGGHVALYELAFDGGGDISRRGLRNTPRASVVDDPSFQEWAQSQETRDRIRDGLHVLPVSFRADVADTGSPTITIAGATEDVQRAFDEGTCNGCHRASHGGIDGGFHVSPVRKGRDRISTFLREDLVRREADLRERLLE